MGFRFGALPCLERINMYGIRQIIAGWIVMPGLLIALRMAY
jgi:hypothetical protein